MPAIAGGMKQTGYVVIGEMDVLGVVDGGLLVVVDRFFGLVGVGLSSPPPMAFCLGCWVAAPRPHSTQ